MEPIAYLLITRSTDPDAISDPIYLQNQMTYLGRPNPDEQQKAYIELDMISVSREHARIIYQNGSFTLENVTGRYDIGLFEQELRPGQQYDLRHADVFRIPNLSEEHFRIIFLLKDKTKVLPILIEEADQRVYIFGERIEIRGLEYHLLHYLYQHSGDLCRYEDIMAHLWTDHAKGTGRRNELDVILSRLRSLIREPGRGFTFIQTVRGQGLRLII